MNKSIENKLNILRAGVLGANDGIISTAGLVIGVASATNDVITILIAGLAGLLAGALSMAGGEYSSVSTQKDIETAEVEREKIRLAKNFQSEENELKLYYIDKGLSEHLAQSVAHELMLKDALRTKMQTNLNITLNEYANPWSAAFSSVFAFSCGAMIPLVFILILPISIRIEGTFIVVTIALALTGYVSAALGGAPKVKALVRNVIVGILTMLITYILGQLVHI